MNKYKLILIAIIATISISIVSCDEDSENLNENPYVLTDLDGNTYNTVVIGDQTWMAENLKVTQLNDGTEIKLIEDYSSWDNLEENAKVMCYLQYETANKDTFGGLYTYTSAINVCPDGWHLPTDEEWIELERYLGMPEDELYLERSRGTNQGSKLAGNIQLWGDVYLTADEEFGSSGFNALPGGARDFPGGFASEGASFWSATSYEENNLRALCRELSWMNSEVLRRAEYKEAGFSVRCVKD